MTTAIESDEPLLAIPITGGVTPLHFIVVGADKDFYGGQEFFFFFFFMSDTTNKQSLKP